MLATWFGQSLYSLNNPIKTAHVCLKCFIYLNILTNTFDPLSQENIWKVCASYTSAIPLTALLTLELSIF